MSVARLILLPGMGADERLFRHQQIAFPQLTVPTWLPPRRGESLPDYAARFARHVDPGVPFYIGGVSLGGMIAMEITRHLCAKAPESQTPALNHPPESQTPALNNPPIEPRVKACLLIASIRSPDELPRRARLFRAAPSLAAAAMTVVPTLAKMTRLMMGWCLRASSADILQQLSSADPAFLRWAVRAMLTWKSSLPAASLPSPGAHRTDELATLPPTPIFQIHGDRDRILPARLTRPDQLIRGGGHIDLTLTHAEAVNDFLRAHLR